MASTQPLRRSNRKAEQSKAPAPESVVLLSTQEAAKYLSVTVGTLANWRNGQGNVTIPFVKVGSSVKYRRADLNDYIMSRFMQPPVAPPETVSVEFPTRYTPRGRRRRILGSRQARWPTGAQTLEVRRFRS